jgi:hypothetical protein
MPDSTSVSVDNYADLPYEGFTFYGRDGSEVTSIQLKATAAVKNVIKMYLFSKLGDYKDNINKGGPLIAMLGKALTESNANALKNRIEFALQQFKNVVVQNINVKMDNVNKQFIVSITFSDTYNKFVDALNFSIQGN